MEGLNKREFLSKDILIFILIILTTPWTWKIFYDNFFLFLILILIAVILVKLLLVTKLHFILICILCSAFLVASFINLRIGFDRELNKLNYQDEIQINGRHQYYARELGGLFLNRYSLNYYKNYKPVVDKFQRNLFSTLDPNLYFFASHPREREKISEFEKFPSVYLILFVLGVLFCLQFRVLPAMGYLLAAAFVNGFISPAFEFGPLLFYPFMIAIVSVGVIYLITILRYWFKKIQ